MNPSAITADVVCEDFRQAISAIVVDDEFVADIRLSADSIISRDLDLDSVEVVRVFEFFLHKYEAAPLVEWFSSQSVDALMAMTVRDLTEFLARHESRPVLPASDLPVSAIKLNRLAFPAAPQAGADADVQLTYVHGLGGSCATWYFHYLLPLRGRFSQLAHDLRGHGESDYPACGYAVGDHADDLRSLGDAVASPSAPSRRRCFIGYSYGGCVVLDYAHRHARPGDSVVILDSPPVERIDANVVADLRGLLAALRGEPNEAKGSLAMEFTAVMGEAAKSRRTVDRYARRLERLLDTGFPREGVGNRSPSASDLSTIRCPVSLIYAGRGDCLAHAEHLMTHLPNARRLVLDARHDLVSTHADAIRASIVDFIRAYTPPSLCTP